MVKGLIFFFFSFSTSLLQGLRVIKVLISVNINLTSKNTVFRNTVEIQLKYTGNILETHWKYSGNTPEIYWKYTGNWKFIGFETVQVYPEVNKSSSLPKGI